MTEHDRLSSRRDFENQLVTKAWSDEAFKEELLADPKAAIEKAFGLSFPDGVEVQILEESPTQIHFVIPTSPRMADQLSEDEMKQVAGGLVDPDRHRPALRRTPPLNWPKTK